MQKTPVIKYPLKPSEQMERDMNRSFGPRPQLKIPDSHGQMVKTADGKLLGFKAGHIFENQDLAEACKEAGVPCEECPEQAEISSWRKYS